MFLWLFCGLYFWIIMFNPNWCFYFVSLCCSGQLLIDIAQLNSNNMISKYDYCLAKAFPWEKEGDPTILNPNGLNILKIYILIKHMDLKILSAYNKNIGFLYFKHADMFCNKKARLENSSNTFIWNSWRECFCGAYITMKVLTQNWIQREYFFWKFTFSIFLNPCGKRV